MQVAVLGAGGHVGQRAAPALAALGAESLAVGRGETVSAPVAVPLLILAGASEEVRALVRAEAGRGRDIVDVDRDAGHLRWLHDEVAPTARAAGARVIGGAGLRWGVGDLLVAVAAAELERVSEVHVAYTTGGGREVRSPGEQRARLTGLGAPALAWVDGRLQTEPPGAARRLAWFPRPVGPSHAAGVPGGEAVTVPLHQPAVRTVRTYEAVSGWRAELLQAEANVAGTRWGHRFLSRRLAGGRAAPAGTALAARRWGTVVEVTDGTTLVRAWAYGHDPLRVTAELGALLATRLVAPTGDGGVRAPAPAPGALAVSQVVLPSAALDHLAVRTDLRWSMSRITLPTR
jgi:hypothetical protein